MQNPFMWHDLMTSDVAGAKKFYGKVVGWTFGHQPPDYHLLEVGGKQMGGIMALPKDARGMPPVWSGYVYTPDVDKACKKVTSLGGKICREPWDIPGIIRIAVIADPTGPMFNIMQPLSSGDLELPPDGAPGTVGWNELHAGDLNAAWDFYSAMFGWTKGTAMDMRPMGTYQLFQINGKDAGGMMKKHDGMPVTAWMYYFNVAGIEAAVDRVKTANGKVMMGPHQVPGGSWIITGMDPQGAMFSLVSATK